jgi:hypothetical protein
MTRRVIALLVLSATLGLPLLAGCEAQHKDKDEANIKIDTEGHHKGVTVKDND